MTGLSNGEICVLYSPETSLNGAKLLFNKGPPRKITVEDMSDAVTAPHIITPHALPMFRDLDLGRGAKRKREKDRMDPRKSRRPELPVTGPGKGGRVGASATQHVVQNLVRDTMRDEDVSTYSRDCFVPLCLPSGFPIPIGPGSFVDGTYSDVSFHFSRVKHCSSLQTKQIRIHCGQKVSISASLHLERSVVGSGLVPSIGRGHVPRHIQCLVLFVR